MANKTTQKNQIKSPRVPLILIVGGAAVIDGVVAAFLIAMGLQLRFYIAPLISACAGVLFALLFGISNFRFKYTIKYCAIYTLAYIGLCVFSVCEVMGKTELITHLAVTVWAVEHLIAAVAAIVTMAYASRTLRPAGTAGLFVACFMIAVFFATAAGYSYWFFTRGFFGQGDWQIRPLEYVRNEDGEGYTVTGVMEGNGAVVVIPETFNGLPVTEVSATVFDADGVSVVKVEGPDLTLADLDEIERGVKFETLDLQLNKDCIDTIKNNLYDLGHTLNRRNSGAGANLFRLANAASPYGVSEDERYITFCYDEVAYERLGGKLFGTWFGSAGEVFEAADVSDAAYMLHTNEHSDADLDWSFYSADGYIFHGLYTSSGASLDGSAVDKNYDRVEVAFDKIYKVRVGESNDYAKYKIADSLKFSTVNGAKKDFKYVVARYADEFLAAMNVRDGFDLAWKAQGAALGSLADKLNASSDIEVEIDPEWTMRAPEITAIESDLPVAGGGYGVVYGDKTELTGVARAAASSFTLAYSWRRGASDGSVVGSAATYTVESTPFDGGGEYYLVVTTTASDSDLTASATRKTELFVSPRTVNVTWTDPVGTEYSAEEKYLGCALDRSDIVGADDLKWTASEVGQTDFVRVEANSRFVVKNAGVYLADIELSGTAAEKYRIAAGESSHSLTITRHAVAAEWDGLTHVYNNESFSPSVSVTPLSGDEENLTVTCSAAYTDCGNYGVSATLGGSAAGNYTLTGGTETMRITARPITLEWSSETLTYSGSVQYPTVTSASGYASGHSLENLNISYSGYAGNINAGAHSVTANVGNRNYNISSGAEKSYSIEKKDITLVWSDAPLTYSGSAQHPTVTAANDLVGGQSIGSLNISYSGYEANINAGESYTVTASIRNDNYNISGGAQKSYSIGKKGVTLMWSSATLTYSGSAQYPTVTSANGLVGGQNVGTLSISYSGYEGNVDAGDAYTVTAAIGNSNYNISDGAQKSYSIGKKGVTLVWSNETFTYNGEAQYPKVTSANGLVSEQQIGDLSITYSGYASNIDAGEHSVTAVLGNNNYAVSSGAEKSYSIEKKNITLVWSEEPLTYSGSAQHPTVTSANDLVGGQNIGSLNISYSGYASNINAGESYTVTAAIGNGNYNISGGAQKSYSIGKAHLTITITVSSAMSGPERPRISDVRATYEVSGLVNSESPDSVINSVVYKYVSDVSGTEDYRKVTADVTLKSDNYDFTVVPGVLSGEVA